MNSCISCTLSAYPSPFWSGNYWSAFTMWDASQASPGRNSWCYRGRTSRPGHPASRERRQGHQTSPYRNIFDLRLVEPWMWLICQRWIRSHIAASPCWLRRNMTLGGDGLWLRSQRVHQLVPQAWYGRVRARARLYGRGSRDRGPAVPGQWFVGVYVSPAPLQAWLSSETWRQCGLREFAPLLAAVQMVAGMMTASKEL